MWVGFAIPAFIHTLNGLHAYFPTLPNIPIRFWLDPFLVGRPLNALKPFQIVVLMSMVGFSYLLTLEVAFSLWFFFLFFKLQCLIGSMLGFLITKGPGVKWTAYSFSAAQEAGVCLTLAGFALFKARGHIKQLFLSGFGDRSAQSDVQNEPMPAWLTVFGLLGGVSLLIYLSHLMGMSLGICSTLCDLFGWCVYRLNMADYQRRYPFYQSLIFTTKFFPHNTWNGTHNTLNNNVAVHATYRLNLTP